MWLKLIICFIFPSYLSSLPFIPTHFIHSLFSIVNFRFSFHSKNKTTNRTEPYLYGWYHKLNIFCTWLSGVDEVFIIMSPCLNFVRNKANKNSTFCVIFHYLPNILSLPAFNNNNNNNSENKQQKPNVISVDKMVNRNICMRHIFKKNERIVKTTNVTVICHVVDVTRSGEKKFK